MKLPTDLSLPLFVYGLLKPGMPGYELIRPFVAGKPTKSSVVGQLFVRDGLPLLVLNDYARVNGFTLKWNPGQESVAYQSVCKFEPDKHYAWTTVTLNSGESANALEVRYRNKGNVEPIGAMTWTLTDDPAFGPGLDVVEQAVARLAEENLDPWSQFFQAQMAYLLLWSIVERLSALCSGPALDPMKRIDRLHQLPGMADIVRSVVTRTDKVTDSRNPDQSIRLDRDNPRNCFRYYYQVRSNLSHRGKGIHKEFDKVNDSLQEMLSITKQFIEQLRTGEAAS